VFVAAIFVSGCRTITGGIFPHEFEVGGGVVPVPGVPVPEVPVEGGVVGGEDVGSAAASE